MSCRSWLEDVLTLNTRLMRRNSCSWRKEHRGPHKSWEHDGELVPLPLVFTTESWFLFPLCSPCVPFVFPSCSPRVTLVFTLSSPCVPLVFLLCFPCVSLVFTLSSPCFPLVFLLCLQCVPLVFTLCSHCVKYYCIFRGGRSIPIHLISTLIQSSITNYTQVETESKNLSVDHLYSIYK